MPGRPLISFIVIGRNEGWRLARCLESVLSAASDFASSEVIYVDSRSTDSSVEIASGYPGVRVFRITGRYNAAVARNIGAHEARGDVLFFIDGDMEVDATTLHLLYSEQDGLAHEFISGAWTDYNYAADTAQTPLSRVRTCRAEDHFSFRTGGLFLIERSLWDAVGGMRNKLRRNQDFDLSVRLAARGTFLWRRKEVLAIHHTTSPRQNLGKMLRRTLSGASLYRMVSLRDNILNRYQWQYFLRTSYTALLFWLTVAAAILTEAPLLLLGYLAVIGARCLLRGQRKPGVFLASLVLMLWTDILLMWGLLFFWPRNHALSYSAVHANT